MGMPACRKDDITIGFCVVCRKPSAGKIDTASDDVKINGRGVARDTDIVKANCSHTGKIKATSTATKINGKLIAKVGDPFLGDYFGVLTIGSTDTRAG